jgi:nitrate/nitrite transporter NarK
VSRGLAALLVSVAAGFGIISRILFGLLADRIDRLEHAAMGLLALLIAAVAALIVDSGAAGIAVFIVFWVAGSGGGPLLEPLLLPRAFGLAHFGAILGTFGVIETMGLIASPAITGLIFDSTGSYDWALVMFISAHAAAFVLFYVAARMPRPLAAAPPPVVAARWT